MAMSCQALWFEHGLQVQVFRSLCAIFYLKFTVNYTGKEKIAKNPHASLKKPAIPCLPWVQIIMMMILTKSFL